MLRWNVTQKSGNGPKIFNAHFNHFAFSVSAHSLPISLFHYRFLNHWLDQVKCERHVGLNDAE